MLRPKSVCSFTALTSSIESSNSVHTHTCIHVCTGVRWCLQEHIHTYVRMSDGHHKSLQLLGRSLGMLRAYTRLGQARVCAHYAYKRTRTRTHIHTRAGFERFVGFHALEVGNLCLEVRDLMVFRPVGNSIWDSSLYFGFV